MQYICIISQYIQREPQRIYRRDTLKQAMDNFKSSRHVPYQNIRKGKYRGKYMWWPPATTARKKPIGKPNKYPDWNARDKGTQYFLSCLQGCEEKVEVVLHESKIGQTSHDYQVTFSHHVPLSIESNVQAKQEKDSPTSNRTIEMRSFLVIEENRTTEAPAERVRGVAGTSGQLQGT